MLIRRYLHFSTRALLLLTACAACTSVFLRQIQIRQQKLIREVVDAGGTVRMRDWFVPIPGAQVESVAVPADAAARLPIEDLKLFPFLGKVRIEDILVSGESESEPWTFKGTIESQGAPPPISELRQMVVSLAPTTLKPVSNKATSEE